VTDRRNPLKIEENKNLPNLGSNNRKRATQQSREGKGEKKEREVPKKGWYREKVTEDGKDPSYLLTLGPSLFGKERESRSTKEKRVRGSVLWGQMTRTNLKKKIGH